MLPFMKLDVAELVVLAVVLAGLLVVFIMSLVRRQKRLALMAVSALIGVAIAACTIEAELGLVTEPGPHEQPRRLRMLFLGEKVWHGDLESDSEIGRQWAPVVLRWGLFLLVAGIAAAPAWLITTPGTTIAPSSPPRPTSTP